MEKLAKDIFRKNFWLMAAAVALQALSGIFFFAGAIRTMLDVRKGLREMLASYLKETE